MSRKNRSPEKKPVEQRSVNCCRWRTSTAWTTSRTCSREPLPNLWRMVWRPNWMRILVTANTTIRTKLRTTAGTATAAKICEPVLAMSRFLFPVTGKDVLGMWVGENESAKFWATVLNGLRNRGVEDIFIACTDNLTGFDTSMQCSRKRRFRTA